MLSVKDIKDFFLLQNSHAKKELGQNFLIDEKTAKQISSLLDLNKDDNLLEIGPGLGSLTEQLVNKTNRFVAVEYDSKFVEYLNMAFVNTNLVVVKNNILKNNDFDFNKIIGNLPYYITTDILEYICLNFNKLEQGVFMVQKEALTRILSKEGKDFNAFNVLLDYLFDIKKCFDVKKDKFFPMPGVDSVVFKITKKLDKSLDFAKILYKTARILFLNRRKTIFNNLNSFLKNKELTLKILTEAGIEQNQRAETLKLEDIEKISMLLLNSKIIKL